MTSFSTLLNKHIRRCEYSNQHYAKLCEIDRTLMQKYLSGQRLPSNIQLLNTMLDQLRLSPDERLELERAYEYEVFGAEKFSQYRIVKEILENFDGIRADRHAVPPVEAEEHLQTAKKECQTVRSKKQVLKLIWDTLHGASVQDNSELYIIMQPGKPEVDVMLRGFLQNSSICLHHLVCINPHVKDGGVENLELLRSMLPVLSQSVQYDLRFYYGDAREHFSSMSLLPNMIIAGPYVIYFSYDLSSAILFEKEDVRELMLDRFMQLHRQTKSFIVKHENVAEMIDYYQNMHPCDHSLQLQPCFAYTLNEDLLLQVMNTSMEGLDQIISRLCSMMQQWGTQALSHGGFANRNFFTLEGIRDFMESGRIVEFPAMFYEPIPKEWRIVMLKKFYEQISCGLIDAYLLKTERFHVNAGLVVQLTGEDAVHFIVNNPDGSQTVLGIRETGLVHIFREYLTDLKDGNDTETREDTLLIVEREIDRWKQIFNEG